MENPPSFILKGRSVIKCILILRFYLQEQRFSEVKPVCPPVSLGTSWGVHDVCCSCLTTRGDSLLHLFFIYPNPLILLILTLFSSGTRDVWTRDYFIDESWWGSKVSYYYYWFPYVPTYLFLTAERYLCQKSWCHSVCPV